MLIAVSLIFQKSEMTVEKPLLQSVVGDGNCLSKMDSQGNIQQVLTMRDTSVVLYMIVGC